MHTEKEAKTKWCPHARVGSDKTGLGSLNRSITDTELPDHFSCIASQCMAWRWVRNVEVTPKLDSKGVPYGANRKILKPTHGYCGLSGAPNE